MNIHKFSFFLIKVIEKSIEPLYILRLVQSLNEHVCL